MYSQLSDKNRASTEETPAASDENSGILAIKAEAKHITLNTMKADFTLNKSHTTTTSSRSLIVFIYLFVFRHSLKFHAVVVEVRHFVRSKN